MANTFSTQTLKWPWMVTDGFIKRCVMNSQFSNHYFNLGRAFVFSEQVHFHNMEAHHNLSTDFSMYILIFDMEHATSEK